MEQKSAKERLLWAQFDALEMGSGWDDTDIVKPQIMHLSIQKSEISNILRNKLGLRYKKRWYMPANGTGLM